MLGTVLLKHIEETEVGELFIFFLLVKAEIHIKRSRLLCTIDDIFWNL